jgi:hypothetical protein
MTHDTTLRCVGGSIDVIETWLDGRSTTGLMLLGHNMFWRCPVRPRGAAANCGSCRVDLSLESPRVESFGSRAERYDLAGPRWGTQSSILLFTK